MRYGRGYDVVVLHDRLEALSFQLAELEHLRAQVLLAEQKAERMGGKYEEAHADCRRSRGSAGMQQPVPRSATFSAAGNIRYLAQR